VTDPVDAEVIFRHLAAAAKLKRPRGLHRDAWHLQHVVSSDLMSAALSDRHYRSSPRLP